MNKFHYFIKPKNSYQWNIFIIFVEYHSDHSTWPHQKRPTNGLGKVSRFIMTLIANNKFVVFAIGNSNIRSHTSYKIRFEKWLLPSFRSNIKKRKITLLVWSLKKFVGHTLKSLEFGIKPQHIYIYHCSKETRQREWENIIFHDYFRWVT